MVVTSIIIGYVLSIFWSKSAMTRYVKFRNWSFTFTDVVITFVPFLNTGFAVALTMLYHTNKINKKKITKLYFKD